jgi:hypothetical protein
MNMDDHKHKYTDETVDEKGNETCEYCGESQPGQQKDE